MNDYNQRKDKAALVEGRVNAIHNQNNDSHDTDARNYSTTDSRNMSTTDSHDVDSRDYSTTDARNFSTTDARNFSTTDARNIDSHDVITTDSRSYNLNDSHNVTNVYNISQPADEVSKLGERKMKYREYCKHIINNGIINKEGRIKLNELAIQLSLEKSVTQEIEKEVKNSNLSNAVLSSTDQMTLDFILKQIENNSLQIREQLFKLEALADKVEQDNVQFYYYLLLAVEDPSACIKKYENRDCDNYWQSYWTFMAYKRNGMDRKAEAVLGTLDSWSEASGNIVLLQCAGMMYDYVVRNASQESREMVHQSLSGNPSISFLLRPFQEAIYWVVRSNSRQIVESSNPYTNFYLRLFEWKRNQRGAFANNFHSGQNRPPISQSFMSNEGANAINEGIVGRRVQNPVLPPKETQEKTNTTGTTTGTGTGTTPPPPPPIGKIVLGIIAVVAIGYFLFGGSDSKTEENSLPVEQTVSEVKQPQAEQPSKATKKAKQTTSAATPATSKPKQKTETNNKVQTTAPVVQTSAASQPAVESVPMAEMSAEELVSKGVSLVKKFQDGKALSYLTQAANKGSVEASYYIGDLYYNGGNDIDVNNPKAFSYYQTAANSGYAPAQYMVGLMYRNGRGVSKNLTQAKVWLRKAAEKGNSKAIKLLEDL